MGGSRFLQWLCLKELFRRERGQTYFACAPKVTSSIRGTSLLVRFRTMKDTKMKMSQVGGEIPKNCGEEELWVRVMWRKLIFGSASANRRL